MTCACGCGRVLTKRQPKYASRQCIHRVPGFAEKRFSVKRALVPRVTVICARPGCGQTREWVPAIAKIRKYCSRACAYQHMATAPEFAELRSRRTSEATKAKQSQAYRDGLAVAQHDPALAYRRGYQVGYRLAWERWKKRVAFLEERLRIRRTA